MFYRDIDGERETPPRLSVTPPAAVASGLSDVAIEPIVLHDRDPAGQPYFLPRQDLYERIAQEETQLGAAG